MNNLKNKKCTFACLHMPIDCVYIIIGFVIFGGVFNIMIEFLDSIDRLIALEDELARERCPKGSKEIVIEASRMTLLKNEEMKNSCATLDMKKRYEEAAAVYIAGLNRFTCEELLFKAKRILSFKQYEREQSLLTS